MFFVIIILALVFIKANRNPRAWLIFIPVLILNLLWSIFGKLLMGAPQGIVFSALFHSTVVALSVIWLMGHKIGNRNRFVTFLLALLVMVLVGSLSAIFYVSTEYSSNMYIYVTFYSIITAVMLLSFLLTGWNCRKRYSPMRFMLWFGAWLIIMNIVSLLVFLLIGTMLWGAPGANLIVSIFIFLGIGAIMALCIYVIMLPFMILAFKSSFFRERLYALFHLESMYQVSSNQAKMF